MNISAIGLNNNNITTPEKLLTKFKNGERPEYQIGKNDKMQKELENLAKKYKQSVSVEKKAKLIEKERTMLYEELIKPELTLSRNYKDIASIMPKNFSAQEIDDTLRLFNITGIGRMERLAGAYKHKASKKNIEILKKAYKLLDETTTAGNRGRSLIIATLSSIEERNPKLKSDIQKTYKELLNFTKDNNLVESLISENSDFDTLSVIKNFKENPNNDFLFRTLIIKSPYNSTEIKELIAEILENEKSTPEQIRIAILGGGKFKNEKIFEIIKKIALNTKEKDIRKREFAIQSTALYIKNKPQEVKQILGQISRENTMFSTLGKILLDKVNGNYHGQKDRELKYAKLSKKEIDRFKKLFNCYYKSEFPMSTRQINSCQLNTLLFRKQLARFVSTGKHYLIQSDTYTKQALDDVGKRYFFKNAGIYNSGDYMDAFDGISAQKYNMMNPYRINSTNHQNQMAHENGHTVHEMFSQKDTKILTKLYKKAMKEGRVLDYYAAANPYEYFAQGCDAMSSIYKPHKNILTNNPLAHTIYELRDKDPDLFKFIKKVLKKYH